MTGGELLSKATHETYTVDPSVKGLPRWPSGKESACQCRRHRRSLGGEYPLEEEISNPLQYSCLENPMDREAWWATVRGVGKSRTGLRTTDTFCEGKGVPEKIKQN